MEHNGIRLTVGSIRISHASAESESLQMSYVYGLPSITVWEKSKHDSHTVEVLCSFVSQSNGSPGQSSGSAPIPLPPAY